MKLYSKTIHMYECYAFLMNLLFILKLTLSDINVATIAILCLLFSVYFQHINIFTFKVHLFYTAHSYIQFHYQFWQHLLKCILFNIFIDRFRFCFVFVFSLLLCVLFFWAFSSSPAFFVYLSVSYNFIFIFILGLFF